MRKKKIKPKKMLATPENIVTTTKKTSIEYGMSSRAYKPTSIISKTRHNHFLQFSQKQKEEIAAVKSPRLLKKSSASLKKKKRRRN